MGCLETKCIERAKSGAKKAVVHEARIPPLRRVGHSHEEG